MDSRKPLSFLGDTRARLQHFPDDARQEAGFQLNRVQQGKEPSDWKPMPSIGRGACEIRIKERSGAFRVIYVANVGTKIFVLHAFQKKTQKTAQRDIDLAALRFRLIGKV